MEQTEKSDYEVNVETKRHCIVSAVQSSYVVNGVAPTKEQLLDKAKLFYSWIVEPVREYRSPDEIKKVLVDAKMELRIKMACHIIVTDDFVINSMRSIGIDEKEIQCHSVALYKAQLKLNEADAIIYLAEQGSIPDFSDDKLYDPFKPKQV